MRKRHAVRPPPENPHLCVPQASGAAVALARQKRYPPLARRRVTERLRFGGSIFRWSYSDGRVPARIIHTIALSSSSDRCASATARAISTFSSSAVAVSGPFALFSTPEEAAASLSA